MYKNYFYLNRQVIELNAELQGSILTESFSQEKDRLILAFSKDGISSYLIISASQNEPYMHLRDEYHRARKNTVDFFTDYLTATLQAVEIATDDRIIRFRFDKMSLYFAVRGKNTNVILIDETLNTRSFKKTGEAQLENFLEEVTNKKMFSSYFHRPSLDAVTDPVNFISQTKHIFPAISKEMLSEVSFRMKGETLEEFKTELDTVISDIESGDIAVFFSPSVGRVVMAPEAFNIFDSEDKATFSTYLKAIDNFLARRYQLGKSQDLKGLISKYLEHQISRTANKLNEIRAKVDLPSKEDLYRKFGNLLLSNMHTLHKGMKSAELADFYEDGALVNIKLDETKDPKGNADRYFEKARDEKQLRISLRELYENLEKHYRVLIENKNTFENAKEINEYRKIMKDLNIKDEQSGNYKPEEGSKFKHYIIENKYHVYVGKDSANNDLLTVKFAKQNDYWFHARAVPGSHVVLRVENSKEAIPKPVLKKAASLAAFHSKAKTSKLAPVSYTLKKYVTKR
ncbi:MAG TPA: NFACT RNA binding domain-containing protein, partial [Ignavibacteriales bacterium]|nr:NFACT RNA binding domain-containing protein [Ignavibacteriales bacterium]